MYYSILKYFLILNILFLFASCKSKQFNRFDFSKVVLEINSNINATIDSANILVTLTNNSNNEFYFLNNKTISITKNNLLYWNLVVKFKDSIIMYPNYLFCKIPFPERKDYIFLKKGEKYSFSTNINFKNLIIDFENICNLNKNKGEYSLELMYYDKFKTIKNCLSTKIVSNKIKINYE